MRGIYKLSCIRRFLIWAVWNAPLGPLAPYVLGLAIGSRPERCEQTKEDRT